MTTRRLSRLAFAPLALVGSLAAAAQASDGEPEAMTLPQALLELERQSPALAEARGRAEEAAGVARQALAPALPTLTAAAGYTRNSDMARAPFGRLLAVLNPSAPPAPDLLIQPLEVWSASGTVRVPLVAPSAWAEAAAARSAERGASSQLDAARLTLRAALAQAAWSSAAAEEIVAASERAVASADEQAGLAERAVAAGTGVPLSVLQARTEAVKRRSDLARARADLDRARLAAGVLLGRRVGVRITLTPAAAPGPLDGAALAAEALSRRPELAATAAAVEGADRQLLAARLRVVPQLSASAAAFAQDVPLVTGRRDGWRITVDLTWQLYDGGLRYGRAEQARGTALAAGAAAEARRLEIGQAVEDARREVGVAAERLVLAQEQARLAAEAAATARRGFAAGITGSLDVLDSNDRLYAADVALAQARAGLGAALAALDRATGRS